MVGLGIGAIATVPAGACMGWLGSVLLEEAGFNFNNPERFMYSGLFGGVTILASFFAVACAQFTRRSTSESWSSLTPESNAGKFMIGLAAFSLLGLVLGATGAGMMLEFSDKKMSHAEENSRVWTSALVCATGGASLFVMGAAVIGAATAAMYMYDQCKSGGSNNSNGSNNQRAPLLD